MPGKASGLKVAIAAFFATFVSGCGVAEPDSAQIASVREMEAPATAEMYAPSGDMEYEQSDQEMAADEGRGPGQAGERYDRIIENPFRRVTDHPQSTFSIDVDTASYSKVRQYLFDYNQMPRADAVRIEELLNYFSYEYGPPAAEDDVPFATHVAVARCPWNEKHRLVRLALKGREVEKDQRPNSNLVLLIDSSGSMKKHNKLPLLKRGMRMLLNQLNESDRVAVVTYAGSAGVVLESTSADQRNTIMNALQRLEAGGSTNGGQGLQLAYQIARDNFIPGGTNRVLLCTDGDFNVGMTGTDQMVRFVEAESKGGIDLSVLGFGMGNLNDAMLEQISGRGNGNYAFIDTVGEAKKVLVEQLSGTLVTIAKDVKIQIEFNPNHVSAYRLIGYENRMLAKEDFKDDTKDAGEIGAGHSVTALYELVPAGVDPTDAPAEVDQLKYQTTRTPSDAAESDELLTVKLRYKLPQSAESELIERIVMDSNADFNEADQEFQFAAAVAGFGMLLRDSEYRGDWNFDTVRKVASESVGTDPHGFREEFLELIAVAENLHGSR